MISTLSIGISNYNSKELTEIPCAVIDSNNFYETICSTFKNVFNHFNSICLNNISEHVFHDFLKYYIKSINKDDIFIMYFSGHGDINDDIFSFNFIDEKISQTAILDILRTSRGHTIIIIDSCFSGVGLSMSNSLSSTRMSKISVLASVSKTTISPFKDNGSLFTNALCDAIRSLKSFEKISMNDIAETIKKKGVPCFINVEEGENDIVLYNNTNKNIFDKAFSRKTLNKLKYSNTTTKEMLWYSIVDLPQDIKNKIANEYLDIGDNKNEGSWLVRKAIGNFLCSCQFDTEKILDSLDSLNWMEQCIALNTIKYGINEDTSLKLKAIVSNRKNPMCLVWLANLYLTDSEFRSIDVSLDSNLVESEWGVYDIYTRLKKEFSEESLIEKFQEKKMNDKITFLEKLRSDNTPLKQTKIYDYISKKAKKRGRLGIESTNKKWLLSIINGVWRDQLAIDLETYFSNTTSDIIKEELFLCKDFPEVEIRMLILSYFENNRDNFYFYKESLVWGIRDCHPWVRSIALRLFPVSNTILLSLHENIIDNKVYPGLIDLLLTAKEVGYDIKDIISVYNLSDNEIKALNICDE